MPVNTDGRDCIFTSVIGSHNYGLARDTQKNYKIFVAPTFEDLYNGTPIHTKTRLFMNNECEIIDIRNLPQLIWKCHINFIEILHSDYFTFDIRKEDIYTTKIYSLIEDIINKRDEIVTMNLPRMYNSFMNLIEDRTKKILCPSHGSQEYIEKFGYDTKKFQLVMRCMDFIKRFAENNFTDFKDALYYSDNDKSKEEMESYRDGKYTLNEAVNKITEYREFIEEKYLLDYLCRKPDESKCKFIENKIKDIIQINIKRY